MMDFFQKVIEALPDYASGLGITIIVTVVGCALALVFAFVLGLMAGAKFVLTRGVARVVIEFFRGTSLVVQLFWITFALPVLVGYTFDFVIITGTVILALNYGAYASEVVRGSIQAVAPGQWEACTALNFSYWQRMRLVIIPQAWPEMIPPLSTLAILLLKGSALVSMIGLVELTFQAKVLSARPGGEMLFNFGLVLVLYFLLAYGISSGMRYLERRAKRGIGQDIVTTKNPLRTPVEGIA